MHVLLTTTSKFAALGASAVAVSTAMQEKLRYRFAATGPCWIRQGTALKITFLAKASFVDGETFTLTMGKSATPTVFEFDVAGNGVASGNTQINISTDTTNLNVAARAATAIAAALPSLTVTNNADGTLTLVAPDMIMLFSETVANVGFVAASDVMNATAGAGSALVPAGVDVFLSGDDGPHLAVIRDGVSAGNVSLTQIRMY